ncbi:mitochondrial carrier domain-containing protein [Spinellus fusiger]|nr:mitochondrial carrier domain-containing protein [Spinellus fusiger]
MPSYVTSNQLNSYELGFCGGVAGVISRFFIAPLDVVKIRMQLQTHRIQFQPAVNPNYVDVKYKGIIQTMKTIAKEEGIRGLYKGNVPAQYLYVSYSAIEFWAYKELEMVLESMVREDIIITVTRMIDLGTDKTHQLPHIAKTFLSGMVAGSAATTITYPFDLLRTQFAIQTDKVHYKTVLDAVRTIHYTHGIRGFYKGLGPTLVQIMPYMGLVFASYDLIASRLKQMREEGQLQAQHKPWHDSFSGAVSSVIGKTAVYPMDVVRKRMQVNTSLPIPWWTSLRQIIQNEGFISLYKGLFPSLVKVAPAVALTFLVFEETKKGLLLLKKTDTPLSK